MPLLVKILLPGFLLLFLNNTISLESLLPQGPVVPQNLIVPKGNKLVFHVYAKGVQVYKCAHDVTDTTKFVWLFVAPLATLYADSGCSKAVGKHYTGPAWESMDGSKVVGMKIQQADAPDSGSIPWLLVRSVSTTGSGIFSNVTFIQRVNTRGGKAPSLATADKDHKGLEANVPYRAEYYFYVKEP